MVGLQGRVFGTYQLADQLTSGSIAEVYRGRTSAPGGREVVIKIIYPEFAQQPNFRARFEQIVQASRRLSHPHILPLLDSGEQNGYLYLVTPYVAAGTLRDWLRAGRRLGAHDVAPFFRQLCEATGYAHNQGVAHGNIKPSNIFLHESRHVLLGDFGRLWDIRQMDMTHAGPGVEAVEYLAPETVEGPVDPRSDVYSLGGVLFAGLTGRPPFPGSTPFEVCSRHAREPVPHLWDVAPAPEMGSVLLDQVVQRAMAKTPDARFPSALALAQAIESAVHTQPAGLGAPMPAGPGMPPGTPGMGSASLFLGGGSAGLPPAMANAVSPGAVFSPSPLTNALGMPDAPPVSPLSGLVDPGMEEGRSARLALPAPRLGELAVLPTTALPAQPGAQGGWTNGRGSNDLPAQATLRVPAASGSAAAPPPPVPPSTPLSASLLPPADALGPADAPPPGSVEVAPPAPPGAGFVVAGGSAQWPPATTDLVGAPGAPAGLAPPPGFGSGPAGEDAFGSASGDPAGGERSFSPTNLGLPRLTMPELDDMPPDWQERAAAAWPAGGDPEEPPDRWGQSGQWGSAPEGWGQSGQWDGASQPPDAARYGDPRWGGSSADSRSYAVPGEDWSAGMPAASYIPGGEGDTWSRKRRQSGVLGFLRRGGKAATAIAEPEDGESENQPDPFADPSAWASPSDLDRRGRIRGRRDRPHAERPRRRGRLLFLMALLVVVDGAILGVVRPDLCPHNVCATADAQVGTYLSRLATEVEGIFSPRSPLTATPASVKLQTYAGGAASVSLTVKNTGKDPGDWTANGSLPWLSVVPASGTLTPGASAKLTLTAKPGVTVHPAVYDAALLVKVGKSVLTIPTSITVAAAPRLSVSPTALTFMQCQTSQQVKVANTGGGPLSFTATPLESVLTLDVTSGTLKPGASRKITVTLDCTASAGNTYGISLISNGGSAAVTVTFS